MNEVRLEMESLGNLSHDGMPPARSVWGSLEVRPALFTL